MIYYNVSHSNGYVDSRMLFGTPMPFTFEEALTKPVSISCGKGDFPNVKPLGVNDYITLNFHENVYVFGLNSCTAVFVVNNNNEVVYAYHANGGVLSNNSDAYNRLKDIARSDAKVIYARTYRIENDYSEEISKLLLMGFRTENICLITFTPTAFNGLGNVFASFDGNFKFQ